MSSTGTRKAALLLMGLDAATAAELLRAASEETVTRIAAELAYLQSSDEPVDSGQVVREFRRMLDRNGQPTGGKFLKTVLDGALGSERSGQALHSAERLLEQRDPFAPIRRASLDDLAAALTAEPLQVASLVLAELPARSSGILLARLNESDRPVVVSGMAVADRVSPEARARVARRMRDRLAALSEQDQPSAPNEQERVRQLRKVALLLRGMDKASRDTMVQTIEQQDSEAASIVRENMIRWEDIPAIRERSLQEFLRNVAPRELATALVGAEASIIEKLRANMSERAAAALEEETSLLSDPRKEEIVAAREGVAKALRQQFEQGELEFEEEDDDEA